MAASGPCAIASGPDGNLWFTELAGDRIGQMTPAGTMITEFAVPTPSRVPGARHARGRARPLECPRASRW